MKRQDAQDLLWQFTNSGVAPIHEDYYLQYTVGTEFKNQARQFKLEIEKLGTVVNGYMPRVVLGTFGSGKTHFLRYLRLRLRDIDDIENSLLVWINLSELEDKNDFQKLFVKGLHTFDDGLADKDYQRVWRLIYQRLVNNILDQTTSTEPENRNLNEAFVDVAIDTASEVHVVLKAIKLIISPITSQMEKRRALRTAQRIIEQGLSSSAVRAYQDDFVLQLFSLGEGKISYAEFDKALEVILPKSPPEIWTSLVLRLIKQAGYTRVVIFTDEIERAHSSIDTSIEWQKQFAAKILDLFLVLHDQFVDNIASTEFPSVAQIMAMPDYMIEDVIKLLKGALETRLRHRLPLDIIPEDSPIALELINIICQLHEDGKYALCRELRARDPVALEQLKSTTYNRLQYDGVKPRPAIMRYLIPELITVIQADWLE